MTSGKVSAAKIKGPVGTRVLNAHLKSKFPNHTIGASLVYSDESMSKLLEVRWSVEGSQSAEIDSAEVEKAIASFKCEAIEMDAAVITAEKQKAEAERQIVKTLKHRLEQIESRITKIEELWPKTPK